MAVVDRYFGLEMGFLVGLSRAKIARTEKNLLRAETLAMRIRKAKLAAKLFRWHSDCLDLVNQNARVGRWIAEKRGWVPTFENLYDFYRYIHGEVCGGTAIDFLEFDIYAGHSIKL